MKETSKDNDDTPKIGRETRLVFHTTLLIPYGHHQLIPNEWYQHDPKEPKEKNKAQLVQKGKKVGKEIGSDHC
jgi:hypothetical protein